MAWFEAHQTMARHPKTLKLARLIKKDRRYAVGLLHDLFSWALDAAQKDGTLNGATADDIAAALDFTGKTGLSVVDALVESGYIEKDDQGLYRVHDWYDYAGKLMDKREIDRARKRAGSHKEFRWNSVVIPAEEARNGRGIPFASVPNRTVPNLTLGEDIYSTENERKEEKEKKESRNDPGLAAVMSYYLDNIDQNPPGSRLEFVKAIVETKGAEKVKAALEATVKAGRKDWPWVMKAINEA